MERPPDDPTEKMNDLEKLRKAPLNKPKDTESLLEFIKDKYTVQPNTKSRFLNKLQPDILQQF